MPTQTITLTPDQADDLRELLSYAEILEDWLLHAPDHILDELARFAYHDHFHPNSATWWLIEDLGHLRGRAPQDPSRPSPPARPAGGCPQCQGHRTDRNKPNGLFRRPP